MDRRTQGTAAEDTALAHLLQHGLELVCRNFRCRAGELDLVMRDGNTLVIVEVRSRLNQGYGSAADSIDRNKQLKIIRAAQYLLLARRELNRLPVRFDVVTLDPAGRDGQHPAGDCQWIRRAFNADGG